MKSGGQDTSGPLVPIDIVFRGQAVGVVVANTRDLRQRMKGFPVAERFGVIAITVVVGIAVAGPRLAKLLGVKCAGSIT